MTYFETTIKHPITGEKVVVFCKQTLERGVSVVCTDPQYPFIMMTTMIEGESDNITIQPSFFKSQHLFVSNLTS